MGLIVSALVLLVIQQSGKKEMAPVEELPSPTPTPQVLLSYKNDSGFAFEYPDIVTLSEDEKDTESYAHVIFTSEESEGTLSFQVSDTKSKTAQDWLKQNNLLKNKKDISDIPFGDIQAARIATPGGILAVAVDQGALFVIKTEGVDDTDFWKNIFDTIMSSFAFTEPATPTSKHAPASSSGGSTSSDIIFEGEEIVE